MTTIIRAHLRLAAHVGCTYTHTHLNQMTIPETITEVVVAPQMLPTIHPSKQPTNTFFRLKTRLVSNFKEAILACCVVAREIRSLACVGLKILDHLVESCSFSFFVLELDCIAHSVKQTLNPEPLSSYSVERQVELIGKCHGISPLLLVCLCLFNCK